MAAFSFVADEMEKALAQSYAYCESVARAKARHFYPAFGLLPRDQRRAMCALYAFMRMADDLADEPGPIDTKQRALANWRLDFEMALQGRYVHPLHQALHHTLTTYKVPSEYLTDVLDGVEMDLFQTRYERFEDLRCYCYRVASAVGLASIHVWGFHDEAAKAHAESAGIAFQLTNILRDLAEDAGRGRIYLPQEDLRRFAYSFDELKQGKRTESFLQLMQFEVSRAREFYAHGKALMDYLNPPGRRVFRLLMQTYSGLLDVIDERGYDVFSRRIRLNKWRKWKLLLLATRSRWGWA